MSKNQNTSTSVSFFGLLTIVFITLKLTGVITWSWWWVLSPLWGAFTFGILIYIVIIAIATLAKK
jgi:sterol desaturase/sphingolipid hydroxylase (fatty acid hydroxylase superfamily)